MNLARIPRVRAARLNAAGRSKTALAPFRVMVMGGAYRGGVHHAAVGGVAAGAELRQRVRVYEQAWFSVEVHPHTSGFTAGPMFERCHLPSVESRRSRSPCSGARTSPTPWERRSPRASPRGPRDVTAEPCNNPLSFYWGLDGNHYLKPRKKISIRYNTGPWTPVWCGAIAWYSTTP